MADILVPDIPLRAIPLVAIQSEVKGFAPHDDTPIAGLNVGGPVSYTVDGTPGSPVDDKDIVQYLKDHPNERFWMVHLVASFQPDDQTTFMRAWLRVAITGSTDAAPIAWSLSPLRTDTTADVTTSLKLGADIKFAGATVSPSLGADIKQSVVDPLVLGLNELTANPYWQFQTTKTQQLAGAFRCSLIVKAAVGSDVSGAVSLAANVQRKALGIIPYKGDPPDPSTLSFTLK
jgi:hypothetical protein